MVTDRLDPFIRLGFALALVLLGASSVRQSAGMPLLQEVALCSLGVVPLVGGGVYVLKWLWER